VGCAVRPGQDVVVMRVRHPLAAGRGPRPASTGD